MSTAIRTITRSGVSFFVIMDNPSKNVQREKNRKAARDRDKDRIRQLESQVTALENQVMLWHQWYIGAPVIPYNPATGTYEYVHSQHAEVPKVQVIDKTVEAPHTQADIRHIDIPAPHAMASQDPLAIGYQSQSHTRKDAAVGGHRPLPLSYETLEEEEAAELSARLAKEAAELKAARLAKEAADKKAREDEEHAAEKTASTCRETVPFEQRCDEARRVLAEYPDCIPVICEKAARSDLPDIGHYKCLFPRTALSAEVEIAIREKINGTSGQHFVYIFANGEFIIGDKSMSEVYESHKHDDGFLYMSYGCFDDRLTYPSGDKS